MNIETKQRLEENAYRFLMKSNIKSLPIDIDKVASDNGCEIIRLAPEELPENFKCKQDKLFNGAIIKRSDDKYIIIVNPNHPMTRQRFTIAHEIAHLALNHTDIIDCRENIYSGDENEQAANEFASNLLMPRVWIKYVTEYYTESISELSIIFNVSESAMKIRMKAVGKF